MSGPPRREAVRDVAPERPAARLRERSRAARGAAGLEHGLEDACGAAGSRRPPRRAAGARPRGARAGSCRLASRTSAGAGGLERVEQRLQPPARPRGGALRHVAPLRASATTRSSGASTGPSAAARAASASATIDAGLPLAGSWASGAPRRPRARARPGATSARSSPCGARPEAMGTSSTRSAQPPGASGARAKHDGRDAGRRARARAAHGAPRAPRASQRAVLGARRGEEILGELEDDRRGRRERLQLRGARPAGRGGAARPPARERGRAARGGGRGARNGAAGSPGASARAASSADTAASAAGSAASCRRDSPPSVPPSSSAATRVTATPAETATSSAGICDTSPSPMARSA